MGGGEREGNGNHQWPLLLLGINAGLQEFSEAYLFPPLFFYVVFKHKLSIVKLLGPFYFFKKKFFFKFYLKLLRTEYNTKRCKEEGRETKRGRGVYSEVTVGKSQSTCTCQKLTCLQSSQIM